MNLQLNRVDHDPLWVIAQMSGGDGYDAMDLAMRHGWHPIPAWGDEGHDLGSWPLVIVLVRNRDAFEIAEYCEGDITQWAFDTPEERHRAIDQLDRDWSPASNRL